MMNNAYRLIYNSGKKQLAIEKFIKISGHQKSTSSSSMLNFLLGRPLMLCINAFIVRYIYFKYAHWSIKALLYQAKIKTRSLLSQYETLLYHRQK
jgi:hypothetical protein